MKGKGERSRQVLGGGEMRKTLLKDYSKAGYFILLSNYGGTYDYYEQT